MILTNARAIAAALATATIFVAAALSSGAAPAQQETEGVEATPTPTAGRTGAIILPRGVPTPIPGRVLPIVSGCQLPEPKVIMQSDLGFLGEQVGWAIAGLQNGTQTSLEVRTLVDDTLVYQDSRPVVQPFCLSMGSFPLRIPDLHVAIFRGTSVSGEPVVLFETVMAVIPRVTPPTIPTPEPRPAAPTNFRSQVINDTTVRFDWTDNSNNEQGFSIRSGGGEWNTGPNIVTINVGGQIPGSITCFTLWAFNDTGDTLGGIQCARFPERTRP